MVVAIFLVQLVTGCVVVTAMFIMHMAVFRCLIQLLSRCGVNLWLFNFKKAATQGSCTYFTKGCLTYVLYVERDANGDTSQWVVGIQDHVLGVNV